MIADPEVQSGHTLRCLLALALALGPLAAWSQEPLIQITGAGPQLAENIRAHVDVEEGCSTPVNRLNRLIPALERDVQRAAQALGYYGLGQSLSFSADETCWSLHISVQPGQPVRFGEVNISLDTSLANERLFREALEESPVLGGAQLDHSQYESLKSMISAVAIENGFFAARFNRSELAVDPARGVADVHLDFAPGERYQFGEIRISPLNELSTRFIERFLPFEEGTDYSTDQLIALRQNFNESQYFDQVTVTPLLREAQNQQIPVTIELVTRPRRAYMAGVGFSTDVGPRVRLSYEDRYINRRGHRLNADLTLSAMRQEPNISYIIPMRDPVNESLTLSSGFLGQDTETYTSETFRLGATYRTKVWGDWIQNIFVNFQTETFSIDEETANEKSRTNSTIPGINWSRTRSDDPIFPSRGWRLFVQAQGASENLLSSISFMQFQANTKLIRSFGRSRVLLRLDAATTVVDEVETLPATLRFFTGGDTSVRGYQYGELGAVNAEGEVIGGTHLLAASVELDYMVRPGWAAAVFYDTGNSFNDFDDMQLKHSIGLGIRWLSPIGPIRADLAHGLDDGTFRLHVTMGPDL